MAVTRVEELYAEVIFDNAPNLAKTRVEELYAEVILSNSPAASTRGTYIVAVDLNDDGDFVDANEDVSSYVRHIRIEHGGADPISGAPLIGKATVRLKNTDGRFTPTNTASAIYPNFKRGRKIHIQAVISGVVYPRGVFKITDIQPAMSRSDTNCIVEAEGELAGLREAPVAGRDWQSANLKTIIENVASDGGYPGALNVDATSDAPPYVQVPPGRDALSLLADIARTEGGRFYETPNRELRYEERHYRRRAEQTIYATFDREWIEGSLNLEDAIRPEEASAVRVMIEPLTAGPIQEVWRVQQGGIVVPKNNAGAPKILYAEFDNQVINIQQPTFANEDLIAQFTDGSGDASASLAVTLTIKGRRAKISLANSHATKDLRLGHLRLRGQPIITNEHFAGVAVTADEQAVRYPRTIKQSFEAEAASDLGVIPVEFSPFYASSPTFAEALATEMQLRLSTKRQKAVFTLATSDLAKLIVLYDLAVSQRVRIKHTDTHGLDKDFWVDRFIEEAEPFRSVRFTVEAIEVEANQSVWRLGQAMLSATPVLVAF